MAITAESLMLGLGSSASHLLNANEQVAVEAIAVQESSITSRLGNYAYDSFKAAKDFKETPQIEGAVSLQETMMRCLRARIGVHDPEMRHAVRDVDVYLNVIALKISAGVSWMKDTLANADDKLWTIDPTPQPDLSDDGKVAAMSAFAIELQQQGLALQDLPDGFAQTRLQELEDSAKKIEFDQAKEACGRMENLIQDQLEEGNWRETLDAIADDLFTYPYACVKGPVVRRVTSTHWDGNKVVTDKQAKIWVERVSPFDIYASPDSTNTQDGSAIHERMRMTRSALSDCIGLPSFSERAIRAVLTLYPKGYREDGVFDTERDALDTSFLGRNNGRMVDVINTWGRIEGRLLLDWCVEYRVDPADAFPGIEVDPSEFYECELWTINRIVLKAAFNPTPSGMRPYHTASFRDIPGHFAGEGVAQILRDVSRAAQAAARASIKNSALSAGPIAEIREDMLSDEEDRPNKIVPYKVIFTRPGNGNNHAVSLIPIPSVAAELNGVFQGYWRLADEISGIPAYSYGTPEIQGAGSTLGGLSILYNGALKIIKNAIANQDKGIIEPLITALYLLNLHLYPDQSVKADANPKARGASGILSREMVQSRYSDFLPQILNLMQAGIVTKDGAKSFVRQWLNAVGIDADSVLGSNFVQQALTLPGAVPGDPSVDGQQMPQDNQDSSPSSVRGGLEQQPSLTPGTPNPSLDGRSIAAVQSISASQPFTGSA